MRATWSTRRQRSSNVHPDGKTTGETAEEAEVNLLVDFVVAAQEVADRVVRVLSKDASRKPHHAAAQLTNSITDVVIVLTPRHKESRSPAPKTTALRQHVRKRRSGRGNTLERGEASPVRLRRPPSQHRPPLRRCPHRHLPLHPQHRAMHA
jgi:hypothetical protein